LPNLPLDVHAVPDLEEPVSDRLPIAEQLVMRTSEAAPSGSLDSSKHN
jgi:hypothetical protein